MDDISDMVVRWCRQADRSGVLKGDLCMVQQVALQIAMLCDDKDELERHKSNVDVAIRMFDLWLMYEHNEIWSMIEEDKTRRREEEETYCDISELSPDNMEELIKRMNRMGNMEAKST